MPPISCSRSAPLISRTSPAARSCSSQARRSCFDAGAAWAFLALQAARLGYHAHGMSGVEFERAEEALAVPERFRIEAAVAVGRIGDPAALPEKLRAREVPSDRKPLDEIVFEGRFPG